MIMRYKRASNKLYEIATNLLEKVYYQFGGVTHIWTDHQQSFCSHLLRGITDLFGTIHTKSATLHPQSNRVERIWQSVTVKCATYLRNHSDWDELCNLICQLHNQTPNQGIGNLRPIDLILAHPPNPILAEKLTIHEGIPPTAHEFVKQTKERIEKVDKFVREVLLTNHVRNT